MSGIGVRREIGLFIVDNDPSVSTSLRNFLELQFGDLLLISIFSSGAEALAAIDQKTEIIVLENYLTGETGTDIRHSIKRKNRLIQVLSLGTDREIVDAIEIYSTGYRRTSLNEPGRRTFLSPVYKVLTYPARKLAKEFEVSEILAVVLTSIFFIGIVVSLWMAFFS
jgi:DNA-binding NarL/FixJ family response regulator